MDEVMGLALAGALIGLLYGATVQRSHFCIMGAISDVALFGSTRRLRSWLLAIGLAMAGTQALALAGLAAPSRSVHLSSGAPWLALLLGGLMFGFGMVLAGGCASRNLVRVGGGSLKALLVVVVLAVAALATATGLLSVLGPALAAADLPGAGLAVSPGGLLAEAGSAAAILVDGLAGITIGVALLAWCLASSTFRRSPRELWAGVAIGLLACAAWLAASLAPAGGPLVGLTFVEPAGGILALLLSGAGTGIFGVAALLGTLAGAAGAARAAGRFRVERFADRADLARHVTGAVLMGVGGILALGCTIGQGVTGLATLALGSALATAAIVAGALWALRWLETGHLLPLRAAAPQG
ncbi:YeeE/YedE family protein [Geminicoccaceae bacterium 1502E]|nr:YeeE/YedE family protein [Geminicoccaceae bacterium 1502E]